jgi:hypothetical protein
MHVLLTNTTKGSYYPFFASFAESVGVAITQGDMAPVACHHLSMER